MTAFEYLTVVGLAVVVALLVHLVISGGGLRLWRAVNASAALKRPEFAKGAQQIKRSWPLFELIASETLSSDSKRLTFSIPPNGCKKLPVGRHLLVRADLNGETVVRPYTPTVFDDAVDGSKKHRFVELVVKVYELGKLSTHLHQLPLGSKVEIFGPTGALKYVAGSNKTLVCVAAGTGLTPVFALAKHALQTESDTRVVLLYQNRTPKDVLLRSELEALAAKHGAKMDLVLVCSRPDADWKTAGGTKRAGYVDGALLDAYLPPAKAGDAKLFYCGPSGFNESIKEAANKRGYEGPELIHAF